jgi:hypothetical protein
MSHVAIWKVPVKSLDVLEAAAKRLGGVLVRNQKSFRWFGHWVDDTPIPDGLFSAVETQRLRAGSREARAKVMNELMSHCDHAISFGPDAYEVGVQRQADGTYALRWDFFNGALPAKIGADGLKLMQAYNIEDAKAMSRAQGYIVTEETRKDGTVEVVVEVQG